MNEDERVARGRFMMLSLLRLAGAAFLTLGLLIIGGKITLPPELGWPFVLIGIADFLFLPWWLAKRWKSPRP